MLTIYGARIVHNETIFTVFPMGEDADEMPQDFDNYADALQYAEENFADYRIETA